jgi:lipid II:glycine glycyltransferase (peptidoglycan interpeptide bridge formation enzyme)
MNNREDFLRKNSLDGGFLQSKYWFDFQKKIDKKAFFIENGDSKVLVIENKLPIVGSYFYVPRGPVFSSEEKDNLILARKIRKKAQEKKINWFRIESQKKEDLKYFEGLIFKSKKNHQPAETLVLDLTKSLEDILAGMKQKTRYNIKLAKKKGVEIITAKNKKDIDCFCELIKETAKRDKVKFHKKYYYQAMFEVVPKRNLELLLAKKDKKIIGGVLVSYFGGVATYLHGASSSKDRNIFYNGRLLKELKRKK